MVARLNTLQSFFFWTYFHLLLIHNVNAQVCSNEQNTVRVTYGRHTMVEPNKQWYTLESIIKFSCPKTFHLVDEYGKKNSPYVWLKCTSLGWNHPWPKCRGPYENITCHNEYLFTAKFEKSWLNETPNRKHALSSHVGEKYIKYATTLKFKCPSGMNFLGAKGLPVMESTCQQDGEWSKEWPMCKGQTCSPYRLLRGYSGTEDRLFTPGTAIHLSCDHIAGFYLYGTNTSTCLPNLSWSGSESRECLTMGRFRTRCLKEGGVYTRSDNYDPLCRKEDNYYALQENESRKTMRTILATAVPLSALFFIFLTASSLYVFRLRRRNYMLASAMREQNEDHAMQMFLPSYEDAEKSKPTTPPPSFDESQQGLMLLPGGRASHQDSTSTSNRRPPASPPPYVVEG